MFGRDHICFFNSRQKMGLDFLYLIRLMLFTLVKILKGRIGTGMLQP